MPPADVLILGGTAEARALAAALTQAGVSVLSSLAGRVSEPALPAGQVRIGGFGGAAGLAAFLRSNPVRMVVDATHPFAATISANAARSCREVGVPLLRLARPGWADHPLAGQWQWAADYPAARELAARGRRVFLTSGRGSLPQFRSLRAEFVLVRLVEPPDGPLPDGWSVLLSRGPYTVDGEQELLRANRIDVLVTKDSGGAMTAAKLVAAHYLGVRVVVVRRPPAGAGGAAVATAGQAAVAVLARLAGDAASSRPAGAAGR
jgi:precorrin-6A/cobalt-precorrin-6A reductase